MAGGSFSNKSGKELAVQPPDNDNTNVSNVDFSTLYCLPFSAPLIFNGLKGGHLTAFAAANDNGIGLADIQSKEKLSPYNVKLQPAMDYLVSGETYYDIFIYDPIRLGLRSGFFYYSSWVGHPKGVFVNSATKNTLVYEKLFPDVLSWAAAAIVGEEKKEVFEKTFSQTIIYWDDSNKMAGLYADWDKIGNYPIGDATFSIIRPYGEEAYNELAAAKYDFANPVKINGRYNFYLQLYENHTKKTQELYLPNIYGLASDAQTGNGEHWGQWALGDDNVWAKPTLLLPDSEVSVNPFNWNTNFNGYLNRIANADLFKLTTPLAQQIPKKKELQKYKTIGISSTSLGAYQEDINIIKQKFPFYVDVEIPTSRPDNEAGPVVSALLMFPEKGIEFFDIFMKTIMASYYPIFKDGSPTPSPPTADIGQVKMDGSLIKGECGSVNLSTVRPSLFSEKISKLYLNALLMSQDFPVPNLKSVDVKDVYSGEVIPGDYIMGKLLNPQIKSEIEEPVIFNPSKKTKALWQINTTWAAVRARLLDIVEEKFRNVKDIYDGKLAHSETLFYEIVKYDVSAGKRTFVQNIFIPNVGPSTLQYLDTQVGFDKKYYYQIYAHEFVIGTEYKNINKYGVEVSSPNPFFGETEAEISGEKYYSSDSWLTSDAKAVESFLVQVAKLNKEEKSYASFQYEYKPIVYMMRVPYHNTYLTAGGAAKKQNNNVDDFDYDKLEKTLVFDKPPVFPDATILPLYGEKNKILVNTNFNVGEYLMDPVLIDGDETTNIDKIRLNQKRMEGPIVYGKDDFGGLIELLRIDKKPTSYKDYSPVSGTRLTLLGGDSAFGFIDDTLEPDKIYYYIVRAKDVHGNYSNPSSVYEVQIITSNGEKPYLVVNVLFMEQLKKEKKKEASNMMKYIKIAPAFLQSYLDQADILASFDSSEEVNTNLVFGEPGKEADVFGRKFKIRFTSKKTGRKFDLNINVKRPSIREAPDAPTKDVSKKAPVSTEYGGYPGQKSWTKKPWKKLKPLPGANDPFPPPNAPGAPEHNIFESSKTPAGAPPPEGVPEGLPGGTTTAQDLKDY